MRSLQLLRPTLRATTPLWCLLILMAWLVAIGASPSQVLAQNKASTTLGTGMPGTKFSDLSFADARLDAYRRKRLLVVYIYESHTVNTRELEKRTWRNPTLAAYCLWHCVTVRYEKREAGSALRCLQRTKPGLRDTGGKYPRVYVLRDMSPPTETNCPIVEFKYSTKSLDDDPMFAMVPSPSGGAIADIIPTPMFVMLQADLVLEGLRTREPAWLMLHEQLNPAPPPPPPPDPLYQVEDESADAVNEADLVERFDATGAPGGGVVIDVLGVLDTARAASKDGNWTKAAGLYTWLWERGEHFDPSFRVARRSVVPAEMRVLAKDYEKAKLRFGYVRDNITERIRWADRGQITDWFLLNGVLGEEMESVYYLDLCINEPDEATVLSRADLAAYRLMTTRDMWTDPWTPLVGEAAIAADSKPKAGRGSVDAIKHINDLNAQRRRVKPPSISMKEWDSLAEFRRDFFIEESMRLHAGCLRLGEENAAWTIADTLLKEVDDGPTRVALATTAIAAGQPRERHLVLLDEAARLGVIPPTLRSRLADLVAKEPKPVESKSK